ncbi:adenosine monophosphate deaminase, putative [Leishmania donovani]|uniref:Adenosine monophosphate deaminase, putative n=1 Tax=Leishmania donovani TaxID=5661 RepID=A0A3S5H592_LEIDO|nr:adenosine monophosphate deaminase, putative [Leishmania donovani]
MSVHATEEAISPPSISGHAGRQHSTSIMCAEDRADNSSGAGSSAAAFRSSSCVSATASAGGVAAGGPLTSWRRSFSPSSAANALSGGCAPITTVHSNSGVGSGASTQSRLRPSSLQHCRASSVMWGGLVGARGGTAAAGSNTNASAVTNVYTLQLPGDDGGVEMAAAKPLLLGALRMRETYKGVDKGHCEVGIGGTGSGASNSLTSAAILAADASRATHSMQGVPHPPQPASQSQHLQTQQQQQQQQVPSPPLMTGPTTLQQVDGVFHWSDEKTPIASWAQFRTDVLALAACVQDPSCVAASKYRLEVLEEKYHLHRLYNADVEENSDHYRRGGGLFANACRVDTCVGAATAMNAQVLVEYIQRTVDERGDDIVGVSDSTPLGRGLATAGASGGSSGVVGASGGEQLTLARVCELLDFPEPYLLTVEGLGLQPSVNRALPYYDALDPSMNGGGRNSAALLRLFLSLDQRPQWGAYLAGVVLPCLRRNELRTGGVQATEMTLEITGALAQEWENTAAWVRTHELDSFCSNQFQLAFPVTKWCSRGGSVGSGAFSFFDMHVGRAYSGEACDDRSITANNMHGVGRGPSDSVANGNAASAAALPPGASSDEAVNYDNYQQLLDHIFLPLFMATLAPEDPKYVDLATLLQHTGAILLTGNENADVMGSTAAGGGGHGCANGTRADGGAAAGKAAALHVDAMSTDWRRRPADTPYTEPVSLTYLCYYIWANLCSLNALRRRRGQNVLQLRVVASSATMPNTSSAHDASLLLLSYLIADVVVDAVALDRQPVLQYLYGLHQIGVAMCPIARSSLGTTSLDEHPVARLLWRGLCVSLCTLNPLYYHSSQEPLLEEYTTAAKMHRLSPTDISEMALHSVCMSSFEDEVKASWVGAGLLRDGWRANAVELTSVPTARLQLRYESWTAERKLLLPPSGSPAGFPTGAAGSVAEIGSPLDDTQSMVRRDMATAARRFTTTPSPHRNASNALAPDGQAGMGLTGGAAAALQSQAPYAVLDPAVDFPRATLIGPFDRDIQNAHLVQALHRALDLRHQYCSLPLPPEPSSSAGAAASDSVSNSDVKAGWLAALTHDPHAVLPHPTQSMSWAFKGTVPSSSPHKKTSGGHAAGATGASSMVHGASSYLQFDEDEWKYKTVEGIIVPHEVHQIPRLPQDMYHYTEFCNHVEEIRCLIDNIRVRDFALRRLQLLEHRFKLHAAVNHSRELGSTAARASHNRDFYQSTKVDNNIRMETGMTARQLLAFIVDKATHNGDDIVSHPKGKEPQTLRQLLADLHITADTLTVDDLNVQAGATSSNGGAPQNPFASEGQQQDELLTLLLKTDNQMNGRYFAELTKRTFEELSRDQHTFSESRLSVYGASAEEWALLSHWFDTHGMSSSHNQWVVQVPRIYSSLRKAGRVASFAEYLEHVFEPLWRISLHPNSDPRLFHFINHIAAFDCVEDERRPDVPLHLAMRSPHEWTTEDEPPYNYYLYHLYANLRSLNRFRQRRRFSVFSFRPSCGEAGSVDHLIGGFLLAQGVNYGVRLADSAPLQYLFYLAQIGVTLSPLSNNTKLQLNYLHNPFPQFFRRGLRVSLGTDSPLLYHHTQEPLLEEYSIASKIWKLSPNDLSEVARNSVLLSNFSLKFKEEKLGAMHFLSSSAGNDVAKTHLSDVRVAYRFEAYHTEVGFLEYISGLHFHRALLTLEMEAQCMQLYGVNANDSSGSTGGGVVGLIDKTPKEADLVKLEAQRTCMQRQLRELTSAVSELHRQNRLLTTKLAEEKERDQLAAQLRRRRVDAKLRELQNLVTQKEVRPHTRAASEHQQPRDTPDDDKGDVDADKSGVPSVPHQLTPCAASVVSPSPLSSMSLRAGSAAASVPPAAVASVATPSALPPPSPPTLHAPADSASSTLRKQQQQGDAVAQTRRLLAHTESLWRTSFVQADGLHGADGGRGKQPLPQLPPLEATITSSSSQPSASPSSLRKRWSPSPLVDD